MEVPFLTIREGMTSLGTRKVDKNVKVWDLGSESEELRYTHLIQIYLQ